MADDLYIRWKKENPDNDVGARPIPDCGNKPVWNNASIYMTEATANPPPIGYQDAIEPVVGDTVKIWVQVWSRGRNFDPLPGARVRAQIWVWHSIAGAPADVSQAVFTASPSTTKIVGASGTSLGTPGVAVVDWLTTINDPSWVDPQTNKVHYCLMANAYWDGPAPADGAEMTSGWPDICNIRRHGQKNINVKPKGDEDVEVPIQIGNHNIEGQPEAYRVEVIERIGAGLLAPGLKTALLAQDFVDLVGGRRVKPRTIRATESDVEEGIVPDLVVPLESMTQARVRGGGRLVLAEGQRAQLRVPRTPTEEVELEGRAGTGRRITVEMPRRGVTKVVLRLGSERRDNPGTTRIFDVVQRDRNRRVVGSFRVVTVQLPR
jgi:hypothetical protein